MKTLYTYLIYSDESHLGQNYPTICAIHSFNNNIKKFNELIDQKKIKIHKWKGNQYNQADINSIVNFMKQQMIHIDAITWDHRDSRHANKGRDDPRNFFLMYRNLYRHILEKTNENDLKAYPHKHQNINWGGVKSSLPPNNISIKPLDQEKEESALLLADFIAGATSAFYENDKKPKRMKLVESFFNTLGITINANKPRRLNTQKFDQFNFWLYEPQIEEDKAPVKKRD